MSVGEGQPSLPPPPALCGCVIGVGASGCPKVQRTGGGGEERAEELKRSCRGARTLPWGQVVTGSRGRAACSAAGVLVALAGCQP